MKCARRGKNIKYNIDTWMKCLILFLNNKLKFQENKKTWTVNLIEINIQLLVFDSHLVLFKIIKEK